MRRKLLVLLPFPPQPNGLHGGARADGQLLSRLAETNDTGILYFRAGSEDPVPDALRQKCCFAIEVPRVGAARGVRGIGHRLRLAASPLRGGLPMWAVDWHDPAFTRVLREVTADWQPDIIQAESHVMAQYFQRKGNGPPQIVVEHEPGAAAAGDRCRMHSGVRRLIEERDAIAWRRYERDVLLNADAVVALTALDAEVLRKLAPEAHVVVLPLGVEFDVETGAEESANVVLFAGNSVHPPNVDAAMRLASEILPRLRHAVPGVRLVLAGANPPRELRRLASADLTVTGFVPELAPLIRRATVVAAPLRYGGGMRVKVLEALAWGKPLVATRLAVEGLPVRDGDHVLIAETDAEFSDAIGHLLLNHERRKQLTAGLRAWAHKNLSWDRTLRGFEDLYESLSSVAF